MAQTFHAQIGDDEHELVFEGDRLLLDGDPVDYVFTRLNAHHFALQLEGKSSGVVVEPTEDETVIVTLDSERMEVQVKDERDLLFERFGMDTGEAAGEETIQAPMPGLVLDVMVDEGDTLAAGDGLLVLEAMKMEMS